MGEVGETNTENKSTEGSLKNVPTSTLLRELLSRKPSFLKGIEARLSPHTKGSENNSRAENYQEEVKEPKAESEIKRFSEEQIKKLKEKGYEIFNLFDDRGEPMSIKKLQSEGKKFNLSYFNNDISDFENLPSIVSQVAVNLNQPIIPNSGYKTWIEQEEMIENLSEKIKEQIPGTKVVRGQIPDLAGVAFQYYDKTGRNLYYGKAGMTQTPYGKSSNVFIGGINYKSLVIGYTSTERGYRDISAPYMVVPDSSQPENPMIKPENIEESKPELNLMPDLTEVSMEDVDGEKADKLQQVVMKEAGVAEKNTEGEAKPVVGAPKKIIVEQFQPQEQNAQLLETGGEADPLVGKFSKAVLGKNVFGKIGPGTKVDGEIINKNSLNSSIGAYDYGPNKSISSFERSPLYSLESTMAGLKNSLPELISSNMVKVDPSRANPENKRLSIFFFSNSKDVDSRASCTPGEVSVEMRAATVAEFLSEITRNPDLLEKFYQKVFSGLDSKLGAPGMHRIKADGFYIISDSNMGEVSKISRIYEAKKIKDFFQTLEKHKYVNGPYGSEEMPKF